MHLSASSEGQCQWHKALPLIICTMTLRPVYPRLCFRAKCKAFKYFIMPRQGWQCRMANGWPSKGTAQAEPKTRGWVWLTLKSGSASRDATSREAPNQATNQPTSSSFSCRCSCSNFYAPCSLFTVTPTCVAYLPHSPLSSLSVSFWSDWNKFNFICSRSVNQRTAAAEQRSPHRLNTKLYFDAYLWGA